MLTPAQQAFAEGFTALAEVHGQTWTFGAASFVGVASPLRSDDPRMVGSADRLYELEVFTADILSAYPVRGDELICGPRYYRIERIDTNIFTGLTCILMADAGPYTAPSSGNTWASIGGTWADYGATTWGALA